ncbi:MAG: hypothetical protein KFF73_15770 [Cyclobacteriaceae bacterium]|nr:hypothetical protein [Cyclobacteriaceae bacterium]
MIVRLAPVFSDDRHVPGGQPAPDKVRKPAGPAAKVVRIRWSGKAHGTLPEFRGLPVKCYPNTIPPG